MKSKKRNQKNPHPKRSCAKARDPIQKKKRLSWSPGPNNAAPPATYASRRYCHKNAVMQRLSKYQTKLNKARNARRAPPPANLLPVKVLTTPTHHHGVSATKFSTTSVTTNLTMNKHFIFIFHQINAPLIRVLPHTSSPHYFCINRFPRRALQRPPEGPVPRKSNGLLYPLDTTPPQYPAGTAQTFYRTPPPPSPVSCTPGPLRPDAGLHPRLGHLWPG